MMRRNLPWFFLLLLSIALPVLATRAGPNMRVDGKPASTTSGEFLLDFAQGVNVDPGDSHKNLTIYPIMVTGVHVPRVTLNLDTAAAKNLIDVVELKQSEVNRLQIASHAKEPIFIMAGEMVRGGKQDRIMTDDLVIAPGDTLTVAVYCVEHGRWQDSGGGGRFHMGHSVAGAGARAGGMRGGQGAVWDSVATQQYRLKTESSTQALRDVHDSASVKKLIAPYVKVFSDFPSRHPKASGLVAVVNGEILAVDLFSSPALFGRSWPQILEAYTIDAVEQAESHPVSHHSHAAIARADIQKWLGRCISGGRTKKLTPGEGDLFELRDKTGQGEALVWDRGVVHIGLFPQQPEAKPSPPPYNPMPYRRGRTGGGGYR